jgi:hypothetical protein
MYLLVPDVPEEPFEPEVEEPDVPEEPFEPEV